MKLFIKKVESCKDCPNYVGGGVSVCHNDKKHPREICTFLDTIDWLKDKEHIKDPLSIPDWCPLMTISEIPKVYIGGMSTIGTSGTSGSAGISHKDIEIPNKNKKCKKCNEGYYIETSILDDIGGVLHCSKCGHQIDTYSSRKKNFKK
jgi:hypothetical protein